MTDPLVVARDALSWYADEARALQRHMASGAHTPAVLASLTVLALDAGYRAEAAISTIEAAIAQQPKDSGVPASPSRSPSQAPPIAHAAGEVRSGEEIIRLAKEFASRFAHAMQPNGWPEPLDARISASDAALSVLEAAVRREFGFSQCP